MTTFFFVVRTVQRYTEKAAMGIAKVCKDEQIMSGKVPIKSIVVPPDLTGIVIVEAQYKYQVLDTIKQVKHTRGILPGKLTLEEVLSLMEGKEEYLEEGALVRVNSGPFKDCEARVIKDDGGMVVVEILEWDRENRISMRRANLDKKEA